ncbi:molybdopterin molybdotransferase MoeA [Leucobacter sp. GX24907]
MTEHAGGTGTGAGANGAGAGSERRSVEEHRLAVEALLAEVASAVEARTAERLAVLDPDLGNRVTAEALTSLVPLPPFDNSQMDGYAVRAEDLAGAGPEHPVALPIGVTTAAGDSRVGHEPGTASPVMTGAPIPDGADAVIPIEEAVPPRFTLLRRAAQFGSAQHGSASPAEAGASVRFTAPVSAGRFVRRRGSDLAEGAEILAAGSRLTPARIGALASAGHTEIPVRPRVRVLLCSTGDELGIDPGAGGESRGVGEIGSGGGASAGAVDASTVDADETDAAPPLPPGRIYDANTPMLAAALRAAGAEVRTVRVEDHPASLQRAITEHTPTTDLLVTTGGVSEGAFEVVREAFAPFGAEFVKVAMQPGGPQGLGVLRFDRSESSPSREAGSLPVLCFPGNPVSAMLSAELLLLPFLRAQAGFAPEKPRKQRLVAHDADSPVDKLQLRRGTLDENGRVMLSGPSSHLLAGLAAADVIAEIPVGVAHVTENTPLTVWSIND